MAAEEATDLEAELLADSRITTGCAVCSWIADRDDSMKWDRAFQNPRITKAAILRGMARRGFTAKATSVGNHHREKHRVG